MNLSPGLPLSSSRGNSSVHMRLFVYQAHLPAHGPLLLLFTPQQPCEAGSFIVPMKCVRVFVGTER